MYLAGGVGRAGVRAVLHGGDARGAQGSGQVGVGQEAAGPHHRGVSDLHAGEQRKSPSQAPAERRSCLRSVGAGAVGLAPLGPQEIVLQLAAVSVAGGVVEVVAGTGVAAKPGHWMRAAAVPLHLPATAIRDETRLLDREH